MTTPILTRKLLFKVGLISSTLVGGASLAKFAYDDIKDKGLFSAHMATLSKCMCNQTLEISSFPWKRHYHVTASLPSPNRATPESRLVNFASFDYLSRPIVVGPVESILAANTVVFGFWRIPSYRIRHMMNRLFLTSPSLASQSGWKGPATLLLSTYSHYSFLHYMFNMLAFFSFGLALLNGRDTPRTPRLDSASFLGLYTTAGILSSWGSNRFSARLRSNIPCLGASGAVFALFTYYCLCYPSRRVALFFIPMDAMVASGLLFLGNLYLMNRQYMAAVRHLPPPRINGVSHLIGTAVGAAWYFIARATYKPKDERPRFRSGIEL